MGVCVCVGFDVGRRVTIWGNHHNDDMSTTRWAKLSMVKTGGPKGIVLTPCAFTMAELHAVSMPGKESGWQTPKPGLRDLHSDVEWIPATEALPEEPRLVLGLGWGTLRSRQESLSPVTFCLSILSLGCNMAMGQNPYPQ